MKTREFIVNNQNNLRLDLFLSLQIGDLSRRKIRDEINEGNIQVNGKVEYRPHYKTKIEDKIELKTSLNNNVTNTFQEIIPSNIKLDIIYEDNDLLVLNKPAGMVSHPAVGHEKDTLLNGVIYHFAQLKNIGIKGRSGLIHRLDKDTSGLILVGKTNFGLWYYSRLFAERKLQKTYIVVVKGDITKLFENRKVLTVNNFLDRNKKNRKKFASTQNYKGHSASTDFVLNKVSEIGGQNVSTLLALPKTGRTHQIRVHLSELGFPVLGDQIYGNNKYLRLMLHAWKLKLIMPDGKEVEFVAPLPKEFKSFFNESFQI